MTGVAAVQARISELRVQLQALDPAATRAAGATAATATAGTSSASAATAFAGLADGAGGLDFAELLRLAGAGAAPSAATGPATAPSGGRTGADLIDAAKAYLGVPYRWGGTDPASGLDCSALVQRAMRDIGVDVPRTVSQQRHVGTEVGSLDKARPGDLIVLGGDRHIGIYVGDNRMLHAPRTGDVVKIGSVYETPTSIRRVLPDVAPAAPAVDAAAAMRPAALRGSGTPFDSLFASATQRHGLPPGLLSAVARTESSYNPNAVSPAGALGLMQIMPGTARELGVDPRDPAQAVDGAARLLRKHLDTFGSLPLALAAYNAGPGAVRRFDGVPPYAETQNYVKKITTLLGGS